MPAIAAQLADAHASPAVAGANAALEARLLAAHAWRMSAEELVSVRNDARDTRAFAALVERRMKAEPVAQILGEKHFWRDVFKVSADVLSPARADSETIDRMPAAPPPEP